MPYLCDKIMICKCFFKKSVQKKMSINKKNKIYIAENNTFTDISEILSRKLLPQIVICIFAVTVRIEV